MRLGSIKASFTPEVEECLSCWKRLTRQNLPSFRAVDNDGVGGGQFAAAQHCMRTLATGGRGVEMGEMVGEVTLICGRVAEREIGGCSSARYRDPIVSYSEPLQGPGSSLAQLQLPITASAADRRASPWSSSAQCSNNHVNRIVPLPNKPEMWKHPLINNAYPQSQNCWQFVARIS